MAHRRTSHRRRSSRRSSRSRRRSRGGGYSFGSAYVSPGNLVVQPNARPGGPDCLAASRPGELSGLPYGGLPGMRGGSYTMSMTPFDASRGFVPTPSQAVRTSCEPNTMNPLNMRGGGGGGGDFPVLQGGKSADMMAYHAPTAGYSNTMSGAGSVPMMIQAPYAAKSCLSTGGSRRTRHHKRRRTRHHKRRH